MCGGDSVSVDSIVVFEDVFVKYETSTGGVMALRGVSFTVPKGGSLLFMGPSGSGKTTILETILGIVRPMHGEVRVFGLKPEDEKSIMRVRRRTGYLTQDGMMINELTIMENVLFYCQGRERTVSKDKILELARKLNIESILNKRPDQVSGGEVRRAELLMVLADEPELLLLDEPTSMLDPENSDRVLKVLSEFKDSTTMIITSHDPRLTSISENILNIYGGQLTGSSKGA